MSLPPYTPTIVPQLLVVEGPDGSGKTTQLELLRKHIESFGVEVVVLREPGGTPFGEDLRDVFKKHFGKTDPMAEALLMQAARQQLDVEVIQPAFERRAWVITDRHAPSMFAYQGAGHKLGFSSLINLREGLGRHNRIADATVILHVPAEERERRMDARGERDQIDDATLDFRKRVADAYEEFSHGNWSLALGPMEEVDGTGTVEEVHQRVLEGLYWRLKGLYNE